MHLFEILRLISLFTVQLNVLSINWLLSYHKLDTNRRLGPFFAQLSVLFFPFKFIF